MFEKMMRENWQSSCVACVGAFAQLDIDLGTIDVHLRVYCSCLRRDNGRKWKTDSVNMTSDR